MQFPPHWLTSLFNDSIRSRSVLDTIASKLGADTHPYGQELLTRGLWRTQICRVLKQVGKQLSTREMACVHGLLGDCLVTATSLAKWGYDIPTRCPYCNNGSLDTPFHRLWECPRCAPLRDQELGKFVERAVAAGPSHPLFAHLWLAAPDIDPPV
eukprot:1128104-Pyramimonas_sp.AAC.2